ncbi:hypothetical protein ACHAWF_008204 [Thalassiosira exigua]
MNGSRNVARRRVVASASAPENASATSDSIDERVHNAGQRQRIPRDDRRFDRRNGSTPSRIKRLCRKLGQMRVTDALLLATIASKLASMLWSTWRTSSVASLETDRIAQDGGSTGDWELPKWSQLWMEHKMLFHSPLLYRRDDDDYSVGQHSYVDDDDRVASELNQRRKTIRFKGMFLLTDHDEEDEGDMFDIGYAVVDDIVYDAHQHREKTQSALAQSDFQENTVADEVGVELDHSHPAFEFKKGRRYHLHYIADDDEAHIRFDDDGVREVQDKAGIQLHWKKIEKRDEDIDDDSGDEESEGEVEKGEKGHAEEGNNSKEADSNNPSEHEKKDGIPTGIDADNQKENVTICSHPSFARMYHPTCNELHASLSGHQWLLGEEIYSRKWKKKNQLSPERSHPSKYLSHGFYRDAFLFQRNFASQNEVGKPSTQWDKVVFKTMRHMYKTEESEAEATLRNGRLDPEDKYYPRHLSKYMRKDAMVMELLHSSPRAINIYSHCSMSSVIEFAPIDMEDYILPTFGTVPKKFVRRKSEREDESDQVEPLNGHISPIEKLEIALDMAKCVAVMHGFEDGIIANVDIQLGQFFRGQDGVIKLVDYNRAEPVLYDTEHDKYCKFVNGHPANGIFRSPEENAAGPLTEKIDVFSLGNIFFNILTGLAVWEDHDKDEYTEKIANGVTYPIPELHNPSPAFEDLTRIIKACWTFDVEERPSIFEVVDLLERALSKRRSD